MRFTFRKGLWCRVAKLCASSPNPYIYRYTFYRNKPSKKRKRNKPMLSYIKTSGGKSDHTAEYICCTCIYVFQCPVIHSELSDK